jgi:biotin carboxylase
LKTLSITNDKFLQREIAEKTNISQPKYKLCWNLEIALEAAEEIGYPVILKPIDNRGSIGVSVADNKKELREAWFKSISNSHSRKCIVEDYIEGEMVAVDGFHDSYKFSGLCVSTKEEYLEFENLDKALYFPGKLDNQIENKIFSLNKEIVRAIGIEFGFVHAEYKIEKDTGDIYLIEIANRGGGVYISEKILPEITGLDLMKKFILMSLGEKVEINFKNNYKSKVLMFFLETKGQNPPQIVKENYKEDILVLYTKEKSKLKNIDSGNALRRAGVVILTGGSFNELNKKARKIESKINTIDTEYLWRK